MEEKDAIARLMEEVSRLREENKRLKRELSRISSESEGKYRMLFEYSGYGVVILSPEGRIQDVNRTILKFLNLTEEELVGKSIFELPYCDQSQREFMRRLLDQHKKCKMSIVNEVTCEVKGNSYTLEFTSASVMAGERLCCIAVLIRDVTRRKQYDQRLRQALRENRILLKELHHRIKNNLQVIYSLLSLQERFTRSKKVAEILRGVKSRIKTIGFLHEKLYSRGTFLDRVRSREYLSGILQNITGVFFEKARKVELNTEFEDLEIPLKKAVPLGLIVNEAVSNSLKHAFPSGKGKITVRFGRKGKNLSLTVEDDGVGLPEKLRKNPGRNLGLRLMKILSQQLGGDLKIEVDGGTRITVEFKEEK